MHCRILKDKAIIEGLVSDDGLFCSYNGDKHGSIDRLNLLPPCQPTKIILAGLNYLSHANELEMEAPNEPVIFLKPISSLIGHKDNIQLPHQSNRVDYEAEIAVVIGRHCKDIEPKEAHKVIWGITCLNDITARDLQKKDGQWTRAKSFDTFCPIGPFIAPYTGNRELIVKAHLNGKLVQEGSSSDMIFSIEELVSFISRIMTLNKGDIISTGTPPGIGQLHKGDEICIEIEGVMKLCNFVV